MVASPARADLVCYWFEKARAQIAAGKAKRAGLLATNSIRAARIVKFGANKADVAISSWPCRIGIGSWKARRLTFRWWVLMPAWRTERALMGILFSHQLGSDQRFDLTQAQRLPENSEYRFIGDTKKGTFDIPRQFAEQMLAAPATQTAGRIAMWCGRGSMAMDLTQHLAAHVDYRLRRGYARGRSRLCTKCRLSMSRRHVSARTRSRIAIASRTRSGGYMTTRDLECVPGH